MLSAAGAVATSRGAARAYVLGAIALLILLGAVVATWRYWRNGPQPAEADGWPGDDAVSRNDVEPAAQLQR
jgi:hypothetical protein